MEKEEEIVEAALFVAGRFMSLGELTAFTGINPLSLKEILQKLMQKYSESAIVIAEKESCFKMDIKQDYAWLVNRLATGTSEFTKAEQETLAIIAYKQPIRQSVIVKVRGNKAYEHIKRFMQAGLVHSKRVGHTLELGLSGSFYDYFDLQKKKTEAQKEPNVGV